MRNDKSWFQSLHWRLLLSYLGMMVSILGTAAIAVYPLFSYSLYQHLDQRFLTLAQAAAYSFADIKQDTTAVDALAKRILAEDSPLDRSWQHRIELEERVEWFDPDKQLLAHSDTLFPDLSLQVGSQTLLDVQTRTLTIPAYSDQNAQQRLEGYIRVSESTQTVEEEDILIRVRWGLALGGVIGLFLSGIGAKWLAEQSLKPIERSFQQLKQFTVDASQELRSPLASIQASVEVMQAHPERLASVDVKQLAAIDSATNQMSRLIEDMVLLVTLDADSVKPTQEQILISLDELLEDLLDSFELQSQQQGIALKSDVCPNIYVVGNQALLTRLFSNLIENALLYTPHGGMVLLSMFPIEYSVIVSIEDTGIGIAPEDLPHIFDQFWRSAQARSYWQGGTGLGLAIAHSIAQSHGGQIKICSKLEVGTSVQVRLPRKKAV